MTARSSASRYSETVAAKRSGSATRTPRNPRRLTRHAAAPPAAAMRPGQGADVGRPGPAAATEPGRAEIAPRGDGRGLVGPTVVGDPGSRRGVPAVAAVRVGDEGRRRGGPRPGQQAGQEPRRRAVDADRDDSWMLAERDGRFDGLARRGVFGVAARIAQPRRRTDLVEETDEDLGFADGRDRLDREQVRAGLDAGPPSVAGGRRAGLRRRWCSRRGTPSRRRGTPHTDRPSRRRAAGAARRPRSGSRHGTSSGPGPPGSRSGA